MWSEGRGPRGSSNRPFRQTSLNHFLVLFVLFDKPNNQPKKRSKHASPCCLPPLASAAISRMLIHDDDMACAVEQLHGGYTAAAVLNLITSIGITVHAITSCSPVCERTPGNPLPSPHYSAFALLTSFRNQRSRGGCQSKAQRAGQGSRIN